MKRFLQVVAVLTFVLSVLLSGLCFIPFEQIQNWGALIRRPEDVTPERYGRLVQACLFFSAAGTLFSALLGIFANRVCRFICELINREGEASAEPQSTSDVLLTLVIVLVGFGLRLAFLFQPMAYDESYTYINFASRSLPEAIGDYNSTNNHLLNTFLIYFTTRLFGPEEWAIRIPAFLCGVLLPWRVIIWAREWMGRSAAWIAGALTAVAPALITYSVDARGYMYVALAAIVLDTSCQWLQNTPSARVWLGAWLATVLGLCAMPIMLYAVLGSLGWFVLALLSQEMINRRSLIRKRLSSLILFSATAIVCVLAFYAPAFIFRGTQFLKDPIMRSTTWQAFVESTAFSWQQAFHWWCDSAIPVWIWLPILIVGAYRVGLNGPFWLRFSMPFVAVASINVLKQVAPPPRLFLHLAPWAYLLAGIGVGGCFRNSGQRESSMKHSRIAILVTLMILIAGVFVVVQRPVLFFPEERSGYASVPEVITRIRAEMADEPTSQHLLMAPLPCDLPSLFYMDRNHFRIEHNRLPQRGQTVWLIARPDETPEDVLKSPLIKLSEALPNFQPWETVARFKQLTLYRSVYDHREQGGIETQAPKT